MIKTTINSIKRNIEAKMNKQRFLELVEKFRLNEQLKKNSELNENQLGSEISDEELLELAQLAIQYSGLGHESGGAELLIDEDAVSEDSDLGSFNPTNKKIELSRYYINNVKQGENTFQDFTNTALHEQGHYLNDAYIPQLLKIAKKGKEKNAEVVEEAEKIQYAQDNYVKTKTEPVDALKGLEKLANVKYDDSFAKTIRFSAYKMNQDEWWARKQAIAAQNNMYVKLLKEKTLSEDTKKWIEEQHKLLSEEFEYEKKVRRFSVDSLNKLYQESRSFIDNVVNMDDDFLNKDIMNIQDYVTNNSTIEENAERFISGMQSGKGARLDIILDSILSTKSLSALMIDRKEKSLEEIYKMLETGQYIEINFVIAENLIEAFGFKKMSALAQKLANDGKTKHSGDLVFHMLRKFHNIPTKPPEISDKIFKELYEKEFDENDQIKKFVLPVYESNYIKYKEQLAEFSEKTEFTPRDFVEIKSIKDLAKGYIYNTDLDDDIRKKMQEIYDEAYRIGNKFECYLSAEEQAMARARLEPQAIDDEDLKEKMEIDLTFYWDTFLSETEKEVYGVGFANKLAMKRFQRREFLQNKQFARALSGDIEKEENDEEVFDF